MSVLRVDFSLVQFSEIEDTYFFYDPQHPTSIQFTLNGRWESWDVGWVKHHARCPKVKQIAADAVDRLARDNSAYQQWPSTPIPRPRSVAHLFPPHHVASQLPPQPHPAPICQPFSPQARQSFSPQHPALPSPARPHFGPTSHAIPPQVAERPYSPRRQLPSPLLPQLYSGSSHQHFYPQAVHSPLTPHSQSGTHRPTFSPSGNSSSPPNSRLNVGKTPSTSSEDYHLDLAPRDTPSPAAEASAPPPDLAPTPPSAVSSHPPEIGSTVAASSHAPPLATANDPNVTFRPPSVPAPTVTAVHASTPAPQPAADTSLPHETTSHVGDRYPSLDRDPKIDPQLSTGEVDPNIDPQLAQNSSGWAPQPPPGNTFPPHINGAHSHQLNPDFGPQLAANGPQLPPFSSYNNGALYDESMPGAPVQAVPHLPFLLHKNRDVKIILSLDGDGLRGLSQVLLVESLVGAICTKMDRAIDPYQIFDLIGGSSMGGVLAIMLSRLRLQVHQAREAYKYIAREVFQSKKDFFSTFGSHSAPSTHSGQAVEEAIKTVVSEELGSLDDLLYDNREESADVFVVTTQIQIGTNKAACMRSFQTRRITGPEVDEGMLVWQAMKAAVVAPRYMQPRNGVNWRPVIEPGLVDHGTAKNNPVRDALFECRKLYHYTNNKPFIISIGTGSGLDANREMAEMAKSVTDRNAEAEACGIKFLDENRAHIESGWMKYFRFNVPNMDDVPLEEWCHEEMIKEKTLAYLADSDVRQLFYRCVDQITAILTAVQRQT